MKLPEGYMLTSMTEKQKDAYNKAVDARSGKDRLQAMADFLRTVPTVSESDPAFDKREPAFDMTAIYHDCGTPSCIAGWAELMWDEDSLDMEFHRRIFGMGFDPGWALTNPGIVPWDDVTSEMAANVCETLSSIDDPNLTNVEKAWVAAYEKEHGHPPNIMAEDWED